MQQCLQYVGICAQNLTRQNSMHKIAQVWTRARETAGRRLVSCGILTACPSRQGNLDFSVIIHLSKSALG